MHIIIVLCRTIFIYTVAFFISLIFIFLCIPFVFLPKSIRFDSKIYFALTWLWARITIMITGVRISIIGQHNLPCYPDQPAIILVNHTSSFDIPVVEVLLKRYPHVWISKDLYGKIPLFGFLINRMNVSFSRNEEGKSVSILKRAYRRVAGHARHLVVFPEGRRYDDGKIHGFYQGFALLAARLGRPVVPIVIFGLHKVYSKSSLLVDSSASEVKISIGKSMCHDKSMSREEFTKRVHAWFVQEMGRLSR